MKNNENKENNDGKTMENDNINFSLLATHINHTVELPSFLEDISKVPFKWRSEGSSAVCNCPMTWHTDKNASFHMTKMSDGVWLFQCFGCHSKGNVVKFYMEYTGEDDYKTAVINLCKKLNIECDGDIYLQTYKHVVNRVDKKREMEMANIITSNICRKLIQKDFKKYNKWVSDAYKRLNKAVDDENCDEIEKIGYEAYGKSVE
jgi:DNA primase